MFSQEIFRTGELPGVSASGQILLWNRRVSEGPITRRGKPDAHPWMSLRQGVCPGGGPPAAVAMAADFRGRTTLSLNFSGFSCL
jgi:hypothetical protein